MFIIATSHSNDRKMGVKDNPGRAAAHTALAVRTRTFLTFAVSEGEQTHDIAECGVHYFEAPMEKMYLGRLGASPVFTVATTCVVAS